MRARRSAKEEARGFINGLPGASAARRPGAGFSGRSRPPADALAAAMTGGRPSAVEPSAVGLGAVASGPAPHEELHVIAAEQQLVALALQLQAAQAAVPAELRELRAKLARAAAGLISALEEVQEYARGIHQHARHRTGHARPVSQVLSLVPGARQHGESDAPPVTSENVSGGVPPQATLPEPLTDSEARVLRYLATTHLAGPEIAREMFVSVNTVRTHVRHIYDKLGAHRRSEAVERARALGLLARSPRRPAWGPGQA